MKQLLINQMLTREIQQHLADQEQESDLHIASQSGSLFSSQPPLEVNIKTKKQSKNRVDERAEILRNLDPQVFQDCDFASEHVQDNQTQLSGGSFIAGSHRVVARHKKKMNDNYMLPSSDNAAMQAHQYQNFYTNNNAMTNPLTTFNQVQHDSDIDDSPPTVILTPVNVNQQQRKGNNARQNYSAGRHLVRLNNGKNSQAVLSKSPQNGYEVNFNNDDYQIMMQDEGTFDIRLRTTGQRHFGGGNSASYNHINKQRQPRNNLTQTAYQPVTNPVQQQVYITKATASQRKNVQLLGQQRRLTAAAKYAAKAHANSTAFLSNKSSRDQQARKVVDSKARSTQATTNRRPKQPTIGQQMMLLQQSLNSVASRPQNHMTHLSKQQIDGLNTGFDEEPVFGETTETAASVAARGGAPQSMLIKVDDKSGQDALSNIGGDGQQSRDRNSSHLQTRQVAVHEQRIRNLQAKIQNKRNGSLLRPGTGYQIRSSNAGGPIHRHYPGPNQDLIQQVSGHPHQPMQDSGKLLRKNESDVFGRKKNTFMSLTSNQSGKLNVQNYSRRNQQNHSFMPQKEDILSERPVAIGLNVRGRQNLNHASGSSLLMSETRGDTNTQVFAHSKNLSPNNSTLNRLDKATAQSTKDDEAVLSLSVVRPAGSVAQNQQVKQLNYPLTAQKQPLVAPSKTKKQKKQQLILFTGGDQVKIEVPPPQSNQQAAVLSSSTITTQQPQPGTKRRILLKPATAATQPQYLQTQQKVGEHLKATPEVSKSVGAPRKWITVNNRGGKYEHPNNFTKQLLQPVKQNTATTVLSPNNRKAQVDSDPDQKLEAEKSSEHRTDAGSHLMLINERQKEIMRAQSSSMRSKQHSKLSTPQPNQFQTTVNDNYAVEQVKSLLDQTNVIDTTSLSRDNDASNLGADDYIPKINIDDRSQTSQIANIYIQELIDRCSPAPVVVSGSARGTKDNEVENKAGEEERAIEYFDTHEVSFLTQQVRNLELMADGVDYNRLNQSSILKNETQSHSKRSLSNNKKHVSILEESKQHSKSGSIASRTSSKSGRKTSAHHVLIKSSLVPETLTKPQHTHQHRYHKNCGHSNSHREQHSEGKMHKSLASLNSGSKSGGGRSKFISSPTVREPDQNQKNMPPLSHAEQTALARIYKEEKMIDKRKKNDRSRISSISTNQGLKFKVQRIYAAPVDRSKSPNVVSSQMSRSDQRNSRKGSKTQQAQAKQRLNHSVVERGNPIKCEKCRSRRLVTAIDKESSAPPSSRAANTVGVSRLNNKGSSVKNGIWSSRLGGEKAESTFSQHSMFNSTVKKRSFGHNSTSRMSSNGDYKKILNRKFKISRDLTKYSKVLDYKRTERKLLAFSKSAKGKHLTDMRKRAELVSEQETKWNKERDALKNTDWEDSDLFEAYQESKQLRKPIEKVLQRYAGLKTVVADKMYTDVELQYFMQLIQRKDCKTNSAEVQQENKDAIVLEYFNRSLYTLQALTKLLKIDFHYDRVFQKYETDYTVDTVLTLMMRARKMYHAIEMILTIIKLIEKLKVVEGGEKGGPEDNRDLKDVKTGKPTLPARKLGQMNPEAVKNLKARIRCHIKSFLAQHTLFPVQFKYGGVDQLTYLKTVGVDGRPDSQLTSESRIINLRLGQSSRNSMRSGRSSAFSQKSRKSHKKTNSMHRSTSSYISNNKKKQKQFRPLSKTTRQSVSKKRNGSFSKKKRSSQNVTSQPNGKTQAINTAVL